MVPATPIMAPAMKKTRRIAEGLAPMVRRAVLAHNGQALAAPTCCPMPHLPCHPSPRAAALAMTFGAHLAMSVRGIACAPPR